MSDNPFSNSNASPEDSHQSAANQSTERSPPPSPPPRVRKHPNAMPVAMPGQPPPGHVAAEPNLPVRRGPLTLEERVMNTEHTVHNLLQWFDGLVAKGKLTTYDDDKSRLRAIVADFEMNRPT